MQRKFITNLIFLLFINALVKPLWILGIDLNVQNRLGSDVYGEYFVLFNFTLLLNIILDLGITNFNNRNIAQNRQLLSKHFPAIVLLKFALGVLYLLIVLGCAFYFEYSSFRIQLLLLLAANQFLVSFILYLRSNMAALHLFRTDSIMSVLDRILMIAFCSLLIWGNVLDEPFNIGWFVYAQTVSYIITAIVVFAIVYFRASFSKLNWNSAFLLTVLKKSLPYALLVLLMYFYNRMDTLMLDMMLEDGARESGLYAQGYRLLDAVNMIGFLTAGLLYPIFSYLLKGNVSTAGLVKLSSGFLMTCSIPVAVLTWIYATPIMELFYLEETGYSAEIFRYLMSAFVPVSVSYVFGTLLTANGNLKLLSTIAVFGVLLNFTLNYLFIPSYGAVGTAYTTLATQYFATLAQIIAVLFLFRFRVNLRYLASVIGFAVGCVIIGFAVKTVNGNWMILIGISLGLMFVLAFVSKLLNVKSLLLILKYDKQ